MPHSSPVLEGLAHTGFKEAEWEMPVQVTVARQDEVEVARPTTRIRSVPSLA